MLSSNKTNQGGSMKKGDKIKLAGALLGATLITATAGVADDMKKSGDNMKKTETMKLTKAEKAACEKFLKSKEFAKAADAKQATHKWG